MKSKFIYLLLLLTTTLFSNTKITITGIKEYKITNEKILYLIVAESKNINLKKFKKFRFYNKEKFMSNSYYYLNGKFSTSNLDIEFKKAYFLEGKFIMLDLKGIYKNSIFQAKKAIYNRKSVILKNTKINIGENKYKKYTYKILL